MFIHKTGIMHRGHSVLPRFSFDTSTNHHLVIVIFSNTTPPVPFSTPSTTLPTLPGAHLPNIVTIRHDTEWCAVALRQVCPVAVVTYSAGMREG